ncbi:MAG: TrmH family RNA methyltransferase, partial [Wujia sp.]
MLITSASNDRIKELKKLMKSSAARKEKNCFVVEGIRMFREIPRDRVMEIYVSETAYERNGEDIEKYDIEPTILTDRLYEAVSDTGSPQGILALVRQKEYSLTDLLKDNAFIFILEKLQDPGNVGTIIRTAEGAGATGIMISSDSVDIYNPKVVRSTMGALFRVPIYISNDLLSDIGKLKEIGVEIYGAHLSGKNIYDSSS